MKKIKTTLLVLIILSAINVYPQETAEELAKKLSNPVANMISVPFQFNFQFNINSNYGHQNGYKTLLNIQPVIPVSLTKDFNLINRVILPVINQKDVTGYNEEQTGLGDILYTAFLSPKDSKMIWGIGPVFSLPTATNDLIGSKKLATGPSAVVLAQPGGWTLGGLFNQLWSVAGSSESPDMSSAFLQPFVSYGFKGGFTAGVSSENLYDWKNKMLVSGLVAFNMSQVFKIAGSQTASIQLSPVVYYANSNVRKPDWGVRAALTFIFPK